MIKYGNNNIESIWFGNQEISEAYLGSQLIWSKYDPNSDVYYGKGDLPNVYWSSDFNSDAYSDIKNKDNNYLKFFTYLNDKSFSFVPESALWKTTEPFAFSGVFDAYTDQHVEYNVNVLITGAYLSYYGDSWIITPITGSVGGN